MKRKKVLWISRHPLWSTQIYLLKKMFGNKVVIEQKNMRFEGFHHFVDFVHQKNDEYHIFAVVPERWKTLILEMYDVLIGTIHRPHTKKEKGRKKRYFRISYLGREEEIRKVYGNKGYHRRK